MYQFELDTALLRSEYEERVRWLNSLYGHEDQPEQPGQFTQVREHLLFLLGGNLVSLGERMQSRHKLPAPVTTTK